MSDVFAGLVGATMLGTLLIALAVPLLTFEDTRARTAAWAIISLGVLLIAPLVLRTLVWAWTA